MSSSFKESFRKNKWFLFLGIIIIVFSIHLISLNNYYNMLSKKTNFIYYKDIPYVDKYDKRYDLKYNKLDIFVPKNKKENELLPVMIFVHGGAWTDLVTTKANQKNYLLKSIFFTDNNFILVNVDYRLFPSYKFPVFIEDVATSIKWVYDNIEDYGGNKNIIFLKGHSAGAQIVSLISTDESYLKEQGIDLSKIKATILLEGVGYDMLRSKDFDIDSKMVKKYLSLVFGRDDDSLEKASAINYVDRETNIPPMIIFGAENSIFRIAKIEALDFYLKLIDNDKYAEYYIDNKTHINLNRNFGKKNDFTTERTMRFVNRVLENKIKR